MSILTSSISWSLAATPSHFHASSSAWMKGFAISSVPSTGLIKDTCVPRQMTSPSSLVSSVRRYGSRGSKGAIEGGKAEEGTRKNRG